MSELQIVFIFVGVVLGAIGGHVFVSPLIKLHTPNAYPKEYNDDIEELQENIYYEAPDIENLFYSPKGVSIIRIDDQICVHEREDDAKIWHSSPLKVSINTETHEVTNHE